MSAWRAGVVVLACAIPVTARGIDSLKIDLGTVEGAGWRAAGVELSLALGDDKRTALDLTVSALTLPPPLRSLRKLSIRCPAALITATRTACAAATLRLATPIPHLDFSRARLAFERDDDGLKARFSTVRLAGGELDVDLSRDNGGWQVTLSGAGVGLARLAQSVGAFLPLPVLGIEQGRARLEATLTGREALDALALDVAVRELGFSDQSGLNAGEEVALDMRGAWRRDKTLWDGNGEVRIDGGEVLFDPVALSPGETPLSLDFEAGWDARARRLTVRRFNARHQSVLEATGDLVLDMADSPTIERLSLTLPRTALAGFYQAYIASLVPGSVLAEITASGAFEFSTDWRAAAPSNARLRLHDVAIAETNGRFELSGLDGGIHWQASGSPPETRLRWRGGALGKILLGAGELSGHLLEQGFTLSRPLELPILDGALRVDDFRMERMGQPDSRWRFSGALQPISMERLTAALDWPAMGGTVSGRIPSVRYADNEITVEGTLLTRVFDGQVEIRNLRLESPFGVVPALRADVDVTNISLDALTSAFSFGNIRGRLSGHVHDLVLEDWQPRAFDAQFANPAGDRSRHRISQRAVDNLASIGGAGALVSQTFLRFFEEFSYDRLGIGCRLRNGVCEMNGVGEAKQGYYIVKGGGIPRIDVLGFNRRVDWATLLERLKNVTSAQGPVIK